MVTDKVEPAIIDCFGRDVRVAWCQVRRKRGCQLRELRNKASVANAWVSNFT